MEVKNYINYIKENYKNTLKNLGYGALLVAILNGSSPIFAQSTKLNKASYSIEIGGEDMIDRLNNKLGIKLPDQYEKKVKDQLSEDSLMTDENIVSITENFVLDLMKEDRGISKENQLLIIRYCIYLSLTDTDLVQEQDLSNELLSAFEKVLDRINNCVSVYKKKIHMYVKKKLEDSKQNLDQSKQNLDQSNSELNKTLDKSLWEMVEFYKLYKKNPNSIKPEDLKRSIDAAKNSINLCKKQGIDYKGYFLKELGDKGKVDDIMKFYEVE